MLTFLSHLLYIFSYTYIIYLILLYYKHLNRNNISVLWAIRRISLQKYKIWTYLFIIHSACGTQHYVDVLIIGDISKVYKNFGSFKIIAREEHMVDNSHVSTVKPLDNLMQVVLQSLNMTLFQSFLSHPSFHFSVSVSRIINYKSILFHLCDL